MDIQTLSTHPALFGIFPAYGFCVLIGGLVTAGWAYIEWNKNKYRTWDFAFLASFLLIFALYGAKIWYMIFDFQEAFSGVKDILSLLTIIFIPSFGRSIIGSIVFVPIGIIVWREIWGNEYNSLKIMDIILPAFFIGQAIGRWGNFANQEIYGAQVDSLNWLPNFISDRMFIDGAFRQPLFLYESIADLIGFVTIIAFVKNISSLKKGSAAASYFFLYGLNRSIFELLRDEQFIMKWFNVIPTSFITALLMMLFGIMMLIYLNKNIFIKVKSEIKIKEKIL